MSEKRGEQEDTHQPHEAEGTRERHPWTTLLANARAACDRRPSTTRELPRPTRWTRALAGLLDSGQPRAGA